MHSGVDPCTSTRQIASGNFAWRTPVLSKDQLGDLICNFNEMAVYIVTHLGARNMTDIEYLPGVGGWRHWRWMGPDVLVNKYVKGTTIIDCLGSA